MSKVFTDWKFLQLLARVIGIDKTIRIIEKNMFRQKDKLTTADVDSLYDQAYAKLIDNHESVKQVNGYRLNYYNQFVFDILAGNKNITRKKVLDFGCGCGNLSLALAGLGYDVFGIDLNDKSIAIANSRKAQLFKVDFKCQNFFAVEGNFDYIIFSDVVEHIAKDELNKIFIKTFSMLKDHGVVLIHTPNGKFKVYNPDNYLYLIMAKFIAFSRSIIRKIKRQKLTDKDLIVAFYSQTHINIMTPKQLGKILKGAGFQNIVFHYRNKRPTALFTLLKFVGLSSDLGLIVKK